LEINEFNSTLKDNLYKEGKHWTEEIRFSLNRRFMGNSKKWYHARNTLVGPSIILCIFGVLILYSIPKIHVSLPIAYKVFDSCCKWLCLNSESLIQLTIRNIRSCKYKINPPMKNNSKNKSKEGLWPGIAHPRLSENLNLGVCSPWFYAHRFLHHVCHPLEQPW